MAAQTKVVNIRDGGGCDVYIGRPSKLGNPYVIGVDGNREEAIDKYREHIKRMIKRGEITSEDIMELKGKRLGCFCAPKPCHGDVLVELIEHLEG